jgi:hypothetical protein
MIFLVVLGVLALMFLGLHLYERQRKLKVKGDESDTYAVANGAAFGNAIGQAQMNKLGIKGDEITVKEDLEPVKFKFDD